MLPGASKVSSELMILRLVTAIGVLAHVFVGRRDRSDQRKMSVCLSVVLLLLLLLLLPLLLLLLLLLVLLQLQLVQVLLLLMLLLQQQVLLPTAKL